MKPASPSGTAYSTEHDHLFISYASEDHAFADWLALRLACEGYKVWYDRIKLLGGESYPKDVDHAIKDKTFRLIAVLSRHSLEKPNPLKERTLAMSISKELGVNFVIPLNLDGLSPIELPWSVADLTYIPFYKSWAQGLSQLFKRLAADGVPREREGGLSRVAGWATWEESATASSERLWTNLMPLAEIPKGITQYRVPPKTDTGPLSETWPSYPQGATAFWAFVPPSDDFGFQIAAKREVDWRSPYELLQIRPRDAVAHLIKRHAVAYCLSRGAKLDSTGKYLFFPPGLLEGDKLHFKNYEGRKTYVRVVGVRKFRTALGPSHSRYHLAFSLRPEFRLGKPFLQLGVSVHLTDLDGHEIPAPSAGRRRKALVKTWFNHQWLSRVM